MHDKSVLKLHVAQYAELKGCTLHADYHTKHGCVPVEERQTIKLQTFVCLGPTVLSHKAAGCEPRFWLHTHARTQPTIREKYI